MKAKELLILDYLLQRPNASQRAISKATGISLGHINLIIKNLTAKGFLRFENVTKRRSRYVLTQQGIAERARLSNENVLNVIRNYKKVKQSVSSVLNRLYHEGYREFVMDGEKSELMDVISEVFESYYKDKAVLLWGPADEKEGQVILNLNRRYSTAKNSVNLLGEISL
jgi:DNA-binding MarR family transcriptional regulator